MSNKLGFGTLRSGSGYGIFVDFIYMYGVCFTHSVGIYTLPLFFGGSYQKNTRERWAQPRGNGFHLLSGNVLFAPPMFRLFCWGHGFRCPMSLSVAGIFCWVYLPVEWGEKMKVLPSQTDPSYPCMPQILHPKLAIPMFFMSSVSHWSTRKDTWIKQEESSKWIKSCIRHLNKGNQNDGGLFSWASGPDDWYPSRHQLGLGTCLPPILRWAEEGGG